MHKNDDSIRNTNRPREFSIGDVSRMVDLSQKTIRDYEKMGLIKPRRELRTNNRIYSDFEVEQIKQIRHLIHNEGFTLPCIRRLIQLAPCWNLFDCKVKEDCSAFKNPSCECFENRAVRGTLCDGACEQCGIYINRYSVKEKVLKRPNLPETG